MIKIKLINNYLKRVMKNNLSRQIQSLNGCEFYAENSEDNYDFGVVYDYLDESKTINCNKENLIFITGEPPSVKTYDQDFLNQFGIVITCHQDIRHKGKIIYQQGMPWYIKKSYDELKEIKSFSKTKLISILTSNKLLTKGHQKRYEFALKLKEHFKDKIDIFGRGINEIEDKWDAIADYKYHVAIENSCYNDYWTEKISDSYLCGTYPIYYGCPNIDKYFPENSYSYININDFENSLNIIEKLIKNNVYENSIGFIEESKNLVLDEYNILNLISSICSEKYNPSLKQTKNTLKPEKYFTSKSYTLYKEFKKKPIYFIVDLFKGELDL